MTIAYYIGVDVGTESVRAALVSANGKIEQTAQASLTINKPKPDYFEQSSQEIWQKCCHLIKKIIQGITPDCVRGIGFDATCSLVVLDDNYNPVSISPDEKGNSGNVFDVIMWMDHRAKAQADKINSESHSVLKYIGGKISLEMQPPKLMWIKQDPEKEKKDPKKNCRCNEQKLHYSLQVPSIPGLQPNAYYMRNSLQLRILRHEDVQ
ncbi:unnamed protein product [Clavelina lepadiformis]|uniref:Carbohydrate kinase FGGY N-terminal domain-containing protein n=1 Tax=Clavelina lepadiformis TaxID=159417 RepID=A0ABP0FBU4_CLALP